VEEVRLWILAGRANGGPRGSDYESDGPQGTPAGPSVLKTHLCMATALETASGGDSLLSQVERHAFRRRIQAEPGGAPWIPRPRRHSELRRSLGAEVCVLARIPKTEPWLGAVESGGRCVVQCRLQRAVRETGQVEDLRHWVQALESQFNVDCGAQLQYLDYVCRRPRMAHHRTRTHRARHAPHPRCRVIHGATDG
jgi:hypothetical protein